jgi:hypothetical protein
MVHNNWYQLAWISINWSRCWWICPTAGFVVTIPMDDAPESSHGIVFLSTADPSAPRLLLSLPSSLAPPTGAAIACPSLNMRLCLQRALALLWEMKAMAERMAVAEEAKKTAPHNGLPSLPPFDGQRLPPPYVPPPNRAVFKRNSGAPLGKRPHS